MKRIMFKSKVHRATVTQAELYYEGSLTLDSELMRAADMLPYEKVTIVNVNNGERFETYLLEGPARTGVVCLNGPAARRGAVGDEIIIITYGEYEDSESLRFHQPTVVQVDKSNNIKQITNGLEAFTMVN
ncbi:MAG: aspartate 1-decarboxylase [Bacteroidota bacterium]|nr:aspartate 1-decarboxylase [Bacteroidota bacterium]MDP4233830.1 aspartate 1-decarboxylase [Bacteroidota bacterium]MDP4242471.1 aspartate 1-decarboxylase [Bacteroidota bacterium]MDP4289059.1 aspartate 1-decarboxylase [Bacteroidota bacterium]